MTKYISISINVFNETLTKIQIQNQEILNKLKPQTEETTNK